MRRPRSRLQVSTFPFLAVLLCAMGSLMLFLFIMDRRAKIVERNRALAAREAFAAARLVQTQAQRDARQAEWEKAKEKLHQLLLDQQQQLLAEAAGIQEELTDATQKLQVVRSQYLSVQGAVNGEKGKIFLLQSQFDKEREGVKKIEIKETVNKAELAKATRELLELTAALELLKTQKVQEKDIYSVVPYRGKRGDLRPPIYVECVREGLIFHPEKHLLHAARFSAAALIADVERYAGPLAAEKITKKRDRGPAVEKKGPYVLFLVRPDGISNYYRAQTALRDIDIDFGYELVDEHWVLDFSGSFGVNPKAPPPPTNPPMAFVSRVPAFIGPSGAAGGLPGDPTGSGAGPGGSGPSAPFPGAGQGGNATGPQSAFTTGPRGDGTGTGGSGLSSPFATGPRGYGSGTGGSGLSSPFATGPRGYGSGPGGSGPGGGGFSSTGPQGAGSGPGGIGSGLPAPFATGPPGAGSGPGGSGSGLPSPFTTGPPGTGSGPGGSGSGLPSPFTTGPPGTGNGPGGSGSEPSSPFATGPQGAGSGVRSPGAFGTPGGSLGNPYSVTGLPSPTNGAYPPRDPSFVPLAKGGAGSPTDPFLAMGQRSDVIAFSGAPGSSGGSYGSPGAVPGSPGSGSSGPGGSGFGSGSDTPGSGSSGPGGSGFGSGSGTPGSGSSGPGGSGSSGGPPGSPGSGAGSPGSAGGSPGAAGTPSPNGQTSPGGGGLPSFNMTIPGSTPPKANGSPTAPPGPPSPDGTPGTPGAAGTTSPIGLPTGQGGTSAGAPGGGSGDTSFSRAPLPAAFVPEPRRAPAAPPTLSKVLGNKDFVITIDCYADHVNVYPGGVQFRWAAQNQQTTDQAFVQSITKLIQRRQASVRQGEPPYRPLVRFQVLPDGLRSYYHAYPLLERLRIPMTRENVEE